MTDSRAFCNQVDVSLSMSGLLVYIYIRLIKSLHKVKQERTQGKIQTYFSLVKYYFIGSSLSFFSKDAKLL